MAQFAAAAPKCLARRPAHSAASPVQLHPQRGLLLAVLMNRARRESRAHSATVPESQPMPAQRMAQPAANHLNLSPAKAQGPPSLPVAEQVLSAAALKSLVLWAQASAVDLYRQRVQFAKGQASAAPGCSPPMRLESR
jgi:hypothetical protein